MADEPGNPIGQCEAAGFNSLQKFICIDPDLKCGDLSDPDHDIPGAECAAGCCNCIDSPDQLIGYVDRTDGKRWLRPDAELDGRDAFGDYHNLESTKPWPVPVHSKWEIAPCYYNDGRECHDEDYCDLCAKPIGTGGHGEPTVCDDGTPEKQPMRSIRRDCDHSYGADWIAGNSNTDNIRCRTPWQHGPLRISTTAGNMNNTIFIRSYGCTSNLLIACAGRSIQSTCATSFLRTLLGLFYFLRPTTGPITAECRRNWDSMELQWNASDTVRLAIPPTLSQRLVNGTEWSIKNKALELVRTEDFPVQGGVPVNFKALDHRHTREATEGNHMLGHYRRTWTGQESTLSTWPLVASLPKSFLVKDRSQFVCDVVIRAALVELHIILQHIKVFEGPEELWPHVRARIFIDLGFRWSFADRRMVRNNGGVRPSAGDADRAVYRNSAGAVVDPPSTVEWLGYLGRLSNPANRNMWGTPPNPPSGILPFCNTAAKAVAGIWVPPMVAIRGYPDDGPSRPSIMYLGQISMRPVFVSGCT